MRSPNNRNHFWKIWNDLRKSTFFLFFIFSVKEIASFTIAAIALFEECETWLRLIWSIDVFIDSQFLGAVGKLALISKGAASIPCKISAKRALNLWVARIAILIFVVSLSSLDCHLIVSLCIWVRLGWGRDFMREGGKHLMSI